MSMLKRVARRSSRKIDDAITPGGETYEKIIKSSKETGDDIVKGMDVVVNASLKIVGVAILLPICLLYSCSVLVTQ